MESLSLKMCTNNMQYRSVSPHTWMATSVKTNRSGSSLPKRMEARASQQNSSTHPVVRSQTELVGQSRLSSREGWSPGRDKLGRDGERGEPDAGSQAGGCSLLPGGP